MYSLLHQETRLVCERGLISDKEDGMPNCPYAVTDRASSGAGGCHKFAVGQTLRFSPGLGEDSRRKCRYKVVRQLPEAGNAFLYRIKSETDGHERVVREDQIERW